MVTMPVLFFHLCSLVLEWLRIYSDIFYFVYWVALLHIAPVAVGQVDQDMDSEWLHCWKWIMLLEN